MTAHATRRWLCSFVANSPYGCWRGTVETFCEDKPGLLEGLLADGAMHLHGEVYWAGSRRPARGSGSPQGVA